MKLQNVVYKLGFFAVIAVTGCANAPQGPQTVGLNLSGEKTLVFQKTNADGQKITSEQIVSSVQKNMYELSEVRPVTKFRSETGNLYYVKGIEVIPQSGFITISYVNGNYHSDTGNSYLTRSNAAFSYQVSEDGDTVKAKLIPPASIATKKQSLLGLISSSQLISDQKMIGDISKIYGSLNPSIDLAKEVKGEVNVQYNDESVYANFKRLLGSYKYKGDEKKKFDIEKDAVFSLQNGKEIIPVKISVFPYRNGSKVVYEFEVPYSLKADGTSSYSEESVKGLIAKIEKVAQD